MYINKADEKLLKLGLKSLRQCEASLLVHRTLRKIPDPNVDAALSRVRNSIKAFVEAIKP